MTALRFVCFSVLTVVAATVGRATLDESLRVSLVWPLYGVGVLWIATASRRSRLWDTLALAGTTGAAILLDRGTGGQALAAMVVTVVIAWTWVVVSRWLQPGRPGLSRPRSLWDLVVVMTASGAGALVGAALRATGLGVVPPLDAGSFLLLIIRNYSGILGPVVLGVLLLPHLVPGHRRGLVRAWRGVGTSPVRGLLETAVIVAAGVALARVVFAEDPRPFAFTLVLVVVWAAFRLPALAAVVYALVLGTLGVLATLAGRGQFLVRDELESAAIAQAFLITLVTAAFLIAIDVEERRTATDRARSAEQVAESRATLFSAVIDNLDEGVTVITADDHYTVRNRAARRLTGSRGFLGPKPTDPDQPRIIDEAGMPVPVAEMPHARARAGSRVVRETIRVRLASGAVRHLEVAAIPISGIGGDPRPVVVTTLRDVTRHQEERDQLVGFAGVVAHDLKNPLTVIRGWSESIQEELAADGPPDVASLRSMVARVQSASDQMRSFIDDLLGITVARDRPLDLERLDLSAIAEEVAELRRTGDANARIAVQPGMRVNGDRFLVRQLLDNLIGNAVKYVAPGVRPAVTVSAEPEGSLLRVTVADNGIGIPESMRERVFDTFARAQVAGYSGTGLGLAICARVVERHGGRIWVDDPAGEGTRVSFTLPVAGVE